MTLTTITTIVTAYQFHSGMRGTFVELRNLLRVKSLKDCALSLITLAAKMPLRQLMSHKSAANQIQGLAQITCLTKEILEKRRWRSPIGHDLIRLVQVGTYTTAQQIVLNPHLYPDTTVNYSRVAFGATFVGFVNTCVETVRSVSLQDIENRIEDFKVKGDEILLSAQRKIFDTASRVFSWLGDTDSD